MAVPLQTLYVTVQRIFDIDKKIRLEIRFPLINPIISSRIFILIFGTFEP